MEVHVFRCSCNCKYCCWRLTGGVRHAAAVHLMKKVLYLRRIKNTVGCGETGFLLALSFGGVALQKLASQ